MKYIDVKNTPERSKKKKNIECPATGRLFTKIIAEKTRSYLQV
jgi:hypothetical protein